MGLTYLCRPFDFAQGDINDLSWCQSVYITAEESVGFPHLLSCLYAKLFELLFVNDVWGVH